MGFPFFLILAQLKYTTMHVIFSQLRKDGDSVIFLSFLKENEKTLFVLREFKFKQIEINSKETENYFLFFLC